MVVVRKARSLGTLAMARAAKAQHQRDARSLYDDEDLDSDDDEFDASLLDANLVPAVRRRLLDDRHPYFPPPPAAAKRVKMKRRTRRPVEEMPPLPPLPAFMTQ
ncbi:hypothetical protein BBK36DRAFT_5402 [Trichoderma citrinoviride]|uniref:Uncharacterized protein n=1 Tax=Trichoderma citrinoviride TaxID=58853 RepID=A0A2T4B9R0_9HYPO|nr:hypothetical protein BBK36DRAFT_5402 [Trichoderma citrinoviride]PTB66057.1 hypothetical protein BBK36DRAFT_5402 [Trichoderma citrinoviride]